MPEAHFDWQQPSYLSQRHSSGAVLCNDRYRYSNELNEIEERKRAGSEQISMNTSELRAKSIDELQESLVGLLKDRFNYRMQKSTDQLTQTHLLKQVSREIAQVKTVINEKTGMVNDE